MRPSSSASRRTGSSNYAVRSRSERGGRLLADRLHIKQQQRRPEKHPEHLEGGLGQDPGNHDELVERVILGCVAWTRYDDRVHGASRIKRSGETTRRVYVVVIRIKDRERSHRPGVSTL